MVSFFNTLFPDFYHGLYFILCLVGGGFLNIFLRKIFYKLSEGFSPTEGCHTRKHLIFKTIFYAISRASLFLCLGLGIIIFKEFILDQEVVPENINDVLNRIFWIFILFAQTLFLWHSVRLPLATLRYYNPGNKSVATLLPLMEALIKLGVVGLGVLLLIRITTDTQPAEVLAMLGIGGLAIGLASQDTVKNFFGSAMLLLDSPFHVGDAIEISSGHIGTVEKIGLRSTRVRAGDGALFCIPNSDLANRVIRTISARQTIRESFTLGLTYDTTPEQMELAIKTLESLLSTPELAQTAGKEPRIYFERFGDSALILQVTYHYAEPAYSRSREFRHKLNLDILKRFGELGLNFAFPTQTLYLKKD